MIGYIGLALLIVAYTLRLTKYNEWFIQVNIIASVLLTVHAIILIDIPFIVVNGFVSLLLTFELLKK